MSGLRITEFNEQQKVINMFFAREDILKIQNALFILGTGWEQQGSQMCSSRISCAYAEKVRGLCRADQQCYTLA